MNYLLLLLLLTTMKPVTNARKAYSIEVAEVVSVLLGSKAVNSFVAEPEILHVAIILMTSP